MRAGGVSRSSGVAPRRVSAVAFVRRPATLGGTRRSLCVEVCVSRTIFGDGRLID